MRVLFFGTPACALPTLELLTQQTNVIGCVTQPDAPRDRGEKISPSPVKNWCMKNHIPLLQPSTLSLAKDERQQFEEQCQSLRPDIGIVVAYGKMISSHILTLPRLGVLNVHPSLLPKFRGPSPVPAAILTGEEKTGVTIMKLDEGMDTGPLLAQRAIPIDAQETSITLFEKCFARGADLLMKILPEYYRGELLPQPQNDRDATITRLMRKEDGLITWHESPIIIDRKIRALNPWPGTYTFCHGKRVKILTATFTPPNNLQITTVQPEGKTPMTYNNFIHGYQCTFRPL